MGSSDEIQILLIEDHESDIEACRMSAEIYNDQRSSVEPKVKLIEANTVQAGSEMLEGRLLDAVILDMTLDGGSTEDGIALLAGAKNSHRVPIAIMSGTPSSVTSQRCVRVFTKGEARYEEIFDHLIGLRAEPLYAVMGHGGALDREIQNIFWERVANNEALIDEDGRCISNVDEKAILRQAIAHIQLLSTQSDDKQRPIDMYVKPFDKSKVKTGTIMKLRDCESADDAYRIILSPPCDLVVRPSGNIKTPCVAHCAIVPICTFAARCLRPDNIKGLRSQIKQIINNNYSDYAHWLWAAADFDGGVVDFRDVSSSSLEEIKDAYDITEYVVQEGYMKNILRRFGAFYNRQGQPDIDVGDDLVAAMVDDAWKVINSDGV